MRTTTEKLDTFKNTAICVGGATPSKTRSFVTLKNSSSHTSKKPTKPTVYDFVGIAG